MKTEDIILFAIKTEAQQKPNKKLIIGQKSMTYKELASKIEAKLAKKKLPKNERQFIESFVQNSIIMYKTNPTFRTKMLELASPVKC